MKNVALLGATGSIGQSTLDVVRNHPQRFRMVAVSANKNVEKLASICQSFRPDFAVIADASLHGSLEQALQPLALPTKALAGPEALNFIASLPQVDSVIAGIVGSAGLASTLAAAQAGKQLLLANKEAIVMAGDLLTCALQDSGGSIIPIDSEHNAVFQCLPKTYRQDPETFGIQQITLTASGGPFFGSPIEQLAKVTPTQACAHPKWQMGQKISVDSATLMNKGLEVIEAHWLFGIAASQIDVVIHPQSIVHATVSYRDGSTLAQLGYPDMRTALAYALAYPDRIDSGVAKLNLTHAGRLDFYPPDRSLFPCLDLAYQALNGAQNAPIILNAANEIAVEAFLASQLRFTDIAYVVAATLDSIDSKMARTLDEVLQSDTQARVFARSKVQQRIREY
jgi:1-deoxy-D-xylulose-5-phosphate reductoisomerase